MKGIGDIYNHPNCGECKILDIQGNQYLIEFKETHNRIWCNKDRVNRHHFYDNTKIDILKIGDIYNTINFGKIIILNKNNNKYIIKFLNSGYITEASRQQILFGQIFDKLQPSFAGIGILGIGKWGWNNNIFYNKWISIIKRCYVESNNRYKNYGALGVTICDEFKNYQNFCNWIEYNLNLYLNVELKDLEIDKDIIANINHLESKIYSPETCLLIPSEINGFLSGDKLGTGVYISPNKEKLYIDFKYQDERIVKYFNKVSVENFILAKEKYAKLKYKQWLDLLDKYNLPKFIRNYLLKYDFSFSWKFKDIKEEDLNKILTKY